MKIKLLYKTLVLLGFMGVCAEQSHAQKFPMYVGTYTSRSESDGVYVYDFDLKNGESTLRKSISTSNPSFLTRKGDILYAVNEDAQGKVIAYDLNRDKLISQHETGGAHPCHVAYSSSLPVLLVSNYSGGSLTLYSLDANGGIRNADQHIQYSSSSVNKDRQNHAHIHSSFFSADGKRVYVSDLGGDFIYEYEIIQSADAYSLKELSRIQTKLGGGPRHISFSKNGNHIYTVLELTGELEVFLQDNGVWRSLQVLPIFEKNYKGTQGAADIKTSKNGKYVYATNRGEANVVATYKVRKNGELSLVDVTSVGGKSPRNINLTPDNKWLLVSNQESNAVTVFKIDKHGVPKITKNKIAVPKPVCIIF